MRKKLKIVVTVLVIILAALELLNRLGVINSGSLSAIRAFYYFFQKISYISF